MKEMEYDEFEVLLERSGDGYTARVVDSPTGPVPPLPFVPPEPLGGLPAVRRGVRGERRLKADAPSPPTPKEFGADLFRALFNEKALAILRTSQYVAAKRQRGLRLRLRFADATALANLPWELLYDPERHWFPCQLSRFPTLRFVDLPEPVLPLRVSGPLRMLVVISSPTDLPPLDVEREWTLLREELDPLIKTGRLELERLAVASLEDVRETLMHRDFHIFHYIGHGGSDEETGEGHLAFTGPDGRQRRVTGSQLGVMLSNSPIRLAVLNSCEGGHVSDVDPYASTAIALVEQGIPAVIAMQFQITDAAATAFSRTLYDSVTAGRPVDLAVTLARQAVLAASETEWATPVLYLRAVDGVLFDLAVPSVAEPSAAGKPVGGESASSSPDAAPPAAAPAAAVSPEPGPPAQPRHLHAEVVDGIVNLMWQQPPDHALPVRAWEIWRNGVRHAVVTLPMALDTVPGPGEYRYTVVALGDGEARSPHSHTCTADVPERVRQVVPTRVPAPREAPAPYWQSPPRPVTQPSQPVRRKHRTGWILAVLAAVVLVGWLIWRPASETVDSNSQTGGSSQTNDQPPGPGAVVQEPDLRVGKDSLGEGGGSGELTLNYSVYNSGAAAATNEKVGVTLQGAGFLITANVFQPDASSAKPCAMDTDTSATCFVGSHEVGAVARVSVLLRAESPPPTITVRAVSDESDKNPDDNINIFPLPAS